MDLDEQELIKVFRELGARDPEGWARSEKEEGIPQLLRFLFLQNAWAGIVSEADSSWIEREITSSQRSPDAPYAGLGAVLQTCREKGISDADLTHLARCLQAQTLFSVGYLLEGPTESPPEIGEITWGLFQTDENDAPFGPRIGSLHESVLECDPSGKEMRR